MRDAAKLVIRARLFRIPAVWMITNKLFGEVGEFFGGKCRVRRNRLRHAVKPASSRAERQVVLRALYRLAKTAQEFLQILIALHEVNLRSIHHQQI